MSAVESVANVAVGYGVSLAATLLVLPVFGYGVTVLDAVGIGAVFTIISFARSFALRRLFNRL